MTKEKARNRAPFTMHSSSADGGYHSTLAQFKSGVDVTNLHMDSYGTFGDASMQGPFTNEFVGGHQRRHQELFTEGSVRGEAFSIVPSSGQLRIYGSDQLGNDQSRAIYYRDEFAKRPVNIRNIRTSTGSIAIGNFSNNYEVVQTVGRTTNPRHFAESVESYQQFQERKSFESNVVNSLPVARDSLFDLPERTKHKSIIVSRFSAPGDRYTMSRGFLNPSGEEFSVYNATPFRNESVRIANRRNLATHMPSSNSAIQSGSLHGVNRNPLSKLVGGIELPISSTSSYDNYYVQHAIPQSELGYSWINKNVTSSVAYGYQRDSNDLALEVKPRRIAITDDYDPLTATSQGFTSSANNNHNFGYGHSSWEQTRKHDNQHPKYLRETNQYSFLREDNKNPESITSITQTPVTTKYFPIKHRVKLRDDPTNAEYEMKSTFSNELVYFDSQKGVDVETFLGISSGEKGTFYDSLKKLYINPDPNISNNPLREVNGVKYSEVIFPIGRYSGLKRVRKREKYDEESGTGSYGYDKQFGKQNKFYHPTRLRTTGAKNSLNYTTGLSITGELTTEYDFNTTLPTDFISDASSRVLFDETAGNWAFLFGTTNTSVTARFLQFNNVVKGTVYLDFDVIQGTYNALGLENPDSGENLIIQYRLNSLDSWSIAKVKCNTGNTEDAILLATVARFGNDGYTKFATNTMWTSLSSNIPTNGLKIVDSSGNVFPDTGAEIRIAQTSYSGYQYDHWAIRNLKITQTALSRQKESLAFFPLQTDGASSFPQSASYSSALGELMHDTDESAYTIDPQPSLCFVEHTNINVSSSSGYVLTDYVERLTEKIAERTPGHETYDSFRENHRPLTVGMGIIPEFRISNHIGEYLSDLNFNKPPAEYFSIQGANLPTGDIADTGTENFFDTHMTTEPMTHAKQVIDDHPEMMVSKLKIKCNAVKKLLPYNGFFPATRTVQIGHELSSSFSDSIRGYKDDSNTQQPAQGLQALAKAFMSPGILYNSIKSGYAVDYPVYTGSVPTATTVTTTAQNPQREFSLTTTPDYRLPFETLYDPKGNLPESTPIRFTPSYVSTEPVSPTFPYYAMWGGTSKPNYQLAMHNFLAETVDFFLDEGTLNYFISKPEKEFQEFEAGKTYYMDVVLRDNVEMDRFVNYKGYSDVTGDTFINDAGGTATDFFSGSDGYYCAAFAYGEKEQSTPNRLSLYKNKLGPDGWEICDTITWDNDSTGDLPRRISACSGSQGIFCAIGNQQDYTHGVLGSVRVYKYRPSQSTGQHMFDPVDYDDVTGSLITPTSAGRVLYAYGVETRILPKLDGDGYHVITSDSAHGGIAVNLKSPMSGGLDPSSELTASISTSHNTGVFFLNESSSVNGIKETHIIHNVGLDQSRAGLNSQSALNHHNARMGYPGTYDMINLDFKDTTTENSSSMNGILLVGGCGRAPAGGTSGAERGDIMLWYSGSLHGTASAYYKLSDGGNNDKFGSVVSACMNGTAPNQKYYFAVTSLPNTTSSPNRKAGAIHLFEGKVFQDYEDVPERDDVGSVVNNEFGEPVIVATVRDGPPRLEFSKTAEINLDWLTGSAISASNHPVEFGAQGSLYGQRYSLGLGSLLSIESSHHDHGTENQVYLSFGIDGAIYSGSADNSDRSPHLNAKGALCVTALDGNCSGTGSLAFLPVRTLQGMSSDYVYGGTALRDSIRGTLKIISGSEHPYNKGESLFVFSSPRQSESNDHLPSQASGKSYIFMHTGSAYLKQGNHIGTFNPDETPISSPQFSASLEFKSYYDYKQHGKLYGLPIDFPHDPAYCAYTPPSFYGTAIARVSFTPSVSGKYGVEEIFSNANVEYVNEVEESRVSTYGTHFIKNEFTQNQKESASTVASSVDLFGRTFDPTTTFQVLGSGDTAVPSTVSNDVSEENKRWVISTKFETPVLDFTASVADYSSSYSSNDGRAWNAHGINLDQDLELPRTMWTSYGVTPSSQNGIFFEIKESFSPAAYQDESKKIGSIIGNTGFTADSKKIGRVRGSKEISEAICIIPYVKSSKNSPETSYELYRDYYKEVSTADRILITTVRFNTPNLQRYSSDLGVKSSIGEFFKVISNRTRFAVENNLIEIERTEFDKQRKTYEESLGKIAVKKEDSFSGEEIRETSISRMIDGLKKYIVPPHFDPMRKDTNIRKPYAMYFMEVSHTLDQEDLNNIWQNISPDIAVNFETSEIEISHDINRHNFFGSNEQLREVIVGDLSFIIFKVKRRAKTNYFETTKDAGDDDRFKFDLKGGTSALVPEYSYNWPYDFFSLIENASISMELEMENPPPPQPPPPPPPEPEKKKARKEHIEKLAKQISAPRKVTSPHRPKRGPKKKAGNPYRSSPVPKKSPPRKPKKFKGIS